MNTTTQEDTMTTTQQTIPAHQLRDGDVIVSWVGTTLVRSTVTSDARALGGTGKVAFGLEREGREPWEGRLGRESGVLVERPAATHQKFATDPTGNDLRGEPCGCDAPADHYDGERNGDLVEERPYGGTGRKTPSRRAYLTRHAFPSEATQDVLDIALQAVASAALNLPTNGLPAELIDYLAIRVESAVDMDTDGVEGLSDEAKTRLETYAHSLRVECGRTVLVALGIETGNMAPIDYPTVTRYWLACRNAYGWRG